MRVTEAIGRGIGGLLAPFLAVGSLIRGARLFHPEGVVYRADVRPLVDQGARGRVALRLTGPAIVRLSSGWSPRRSKLPDVLGIAIRFQEDAETHAEPGISDQDLLFESIRSLWALPIAPLTTNSRNFLANNYYAILPFYVAELGRVKWRLIPQRVNVAGSNRLERLQHAVSTGRAVFRLEVRSLRRGAKWKPIAAIELRQRVAMNEEELRFSPFRSGRGIVPIGLLQATRAAAYAASQLGRRISRRPVDP